MWVLVNFKRVKMVDVAGFDKETQIDVSVIVPMYNVENLIEETINSLKNNVCNLEIILINDGSTDNTLSIAQKVTKYDERFIIIDQENKGVSAARNQGLKVAQGQYLLFVDSDDLMSESAIDLLFSTAITKNADYVYGGVKKLSSHGISTIPIHDQLNVFSPGCKNIIENPELFYSMAPTAKLISRNIVCDISFPENITCAEDQVFLFSIFLRAKNIYSLGEYIYFYRERDIEENNLSITQQKDTKAYQYFLDIMSVMEITNEINSESVISNKNKLLNISNYYERVLRFDVWPLLIRVLKYDPNNTEQAFLILTSFLSRLDKKIINKVISTRFYFIKVLTDNIFYIQGYNSFKAYKKFLKFLFDTFDEDIYIYFSKPTHYGSRWDDCYFIATKPIYKSYPFFIYLSAKKRYFKFYNKHKVDFIKNYLFPVFKLLPKNKNKIIFATSNGKPMGSNFTFIINELQKKNNINSKYKIYKFLGNTQKTSKLIFRYFHSATAHTIFLENYFKPYYGVKFSKNTHVVQLWHACGAFKRFGHDALSKKDSNKLEFEVNAHMSYSSIMISSEGIVNHYASAFNKPIEPVKALGVPRTDLFFNSKKIASIKLKIIKRFPYLANTKNILYSPTFRGSPSERKQFTIPIDWNKFKSLPKGMKLIIKLHPVVEKINNPIPDWIKDRVLILDSKENVDEWMIFCDVLITDYSSLVFEYSLLNKPIIYFPYDLESYFDERGFYYSYDTYVYGEIVKDTAALLTAIEQAKFQQAKYAPAKKIFKEKFMNACDGKSSQRIIENLLSN